MNYSDYLEYLPFCRESFYGLGLPWYGVDKLGQIAIFEGGDLPIPNRVFFDKSDYMELYNFFENLPRITKARLVKRFTKTTTFFGKITDYSDALTEAERGVYFIEEKNTFDKGEHLEGYYLIAIPNEKLYVTNLPKRIRQLLQIFNFPIDFSDIEDMEKIDITNYFFCQ